MPPRGERLKQEKPIDVGEVPERFQGILQAFRAFKTREEWRGITEAMPLLIKKTFLIARHVNQAERNEAARNLIKQWKEKIDDETHPEHGEGQDRLLLAFCLSDEQLDLAISTFLPKKMD